MGCKSESCCSVWRIVQSVLGILVGLLSFSVFFWQYGNNQAAAWAFTSGKYVNNTNDFIHVPICRIYRL